MFTSTAAALPSLVQSSITVKLAQVNSNAIQAGAFAASSIRRFSCFFSASSFRKLNRKGM